MTDTDTNTATPPSYSGPIPIPNTLTQRGTPCLWFVCNPTKPDEVFVATIDGARTVLAFSDERRAIVATGRHKLVDRDGAILLLEMPLRDAALWLLRFPERGGVDRLVLDEGPTAERWDVRAFCESLRAATGA